VVRAKDGKAGCPLEAGELYTYKNSFPILKSYPAVSFPDFPLDLGVAVLEVLLSLTNASPSFNY